MAEVRIVDEPGYSNRRLIVEIERQFEIGAEGSAIKTAIIAVTEKFAETWLEENKDKIMERLNVDAIANMIMIEVANSIKKDIREEQK